jgi:hypothetical protein
VNKKLIMKTAGALMAATTTFGLAAPAAMAQDGGSNGVGSGNNVNVGLDIPVAVCGVVVTLLGGDAQGLCPTTREAQAPEGSGSQTASAGDQATSGTQSATTPAPSSASGSGVLSGNDINVDAHVPVTVCGVGVAAAGDAVGNCPPNTPAAPASAPQSAPQSASGRGVLSGNNVNVNARLPILACGIAAALLGADAKALCG